MKENLDVSIVIPVYNEQDSLYTLYDNIVTAINRINKSYEIIFIDDGSTDDSWHVIEKLSQKDNNVKGIKFRRNFGKAEALSAGFELAKGSLIFTMDADLQDDPAEIPNFIAKIEEGFDVVSGWKKTRHDPLEKRLPSKLFNAVTSKLSGLKLHDFNCGFKCYRNEVVKELRVYGERHRFLPVLAHQSGFSVAEIPVQHHARQHGVSKYGFERYIRGLLDVITLTFLGAYKKRPSHFFGGTGLLFMLCGGGIDIYIILLKIFTGTIQRKYPLLVAGVMITIVGVQFITLGLLAELIISSNRDSHIMIPSIKNKVNIQS